MTSIFTVYIFKIIVKDKNTESTGDNF